MTIVDDMVFSPWIVLPLAGASMVALAGHVASLWTEPMPESRRRIRAANGVLMMVASSLLAYVLCVNRDGRMFVLLWGGISLLLLMIVLMAAADMLNTYRLTRRARRALRRAAGVPIGPGAVAIPAPAGAAARGDGAHGERCG